MWQCRGMETRVETQPRPSPVSFGTTGEAERSAVVAEGFSLAEQYALLTDAEREGMAGHKARAEAVSNAYEGVLLDEEQLKRELLGGVHDTHMTSTPAAA